MEPLPLKPTHTRGGAARAYLRRHWQKAIRVREKMLLTEEAFHLLLAGGVGVIGGVVNLCFFHAVRAVEWAIFGQCRSDIVEMAMDLPFWKMIAIPALGGLAAGWILFMGTRFIRKKGTSNLIEVVVAGDGRLPLRNGIIRTVSSMVSIASGASIGREGAITQVTATLASKWGQLAKWQPYRLRLLVGCGAASGIAAAYNAPIAGAVFAAQVVLGNFSMNLFAPLLFASVIASMLSRSLFAVHPWYHVPPHEFTSIAQLPWFIVLGMLAGVVGAVFLKSLQKGEAYLQRVPDLRLRMALGGLAVGAIAVFYPGVLGNGFYGTNEILQSQLELKLLLGVVMAKFVATIITVGSGTIGGVFTPTLFLGTGLGSLLGGALHHFGIALELPTSAFAIVGMGCVLSSTTRSPLLAIIIILEISLNYSLMPALMLGCAVSTLVARRLHPSSIYTQSLKMRSLEVESYRLGAATERAIGDLMHAPVEPVRDNTTLPEIAERFLGSTNNFLPVVDSERRLIGMVSLHDLKEHLNAGRELRAVIAYDVMRPIPGILTPHQRLLDALPILLASEQKNVPVVNTLEEKRLVGSVRRAEALGLFSEVIAASAATSGQKR